MDHLRAASEALPLNSLGEQATRERAIIQEAETHDFWNGGSITDGYHRLRVSELPAFEQQLEEDGKEKLKTDARRVQRCRDRLAATGKESLFSEVQTAFREWRAEAFENPETLLLYTAEERGGHCKEPEFLKHTANEREEPVPDPTNPAHDFKAGFLFFKRHEFGWKKATYRGDAFNKHDRFPNQKMTVYEALFGTQHNPFSRTTDENDQQYLKYIHLPANHMGWVERAIARYYGEEGLHEDERRKTNETLAHEFWEGQVRGGGLGKHPIHARHMRSRCSTIPMGKSFYFQEPEDRHKVFAMFMPYLHWEMYGRKARMAKTLQRFIEPGAETAAAGKLTSVKYSDNEGVENLKEHNSKRFGEVSTGLEFDEAAWQTLQQLRFQKKRKLGHYLMNVAKLWEAMDMEAEERLLKDGLKPPESDVIKSPEPPLHIRRTLDQSYFLNLHDTSRRDQDQVIYRATRLPWSEPGDLTRVVMVDQLWLWVLDDYTIITAFPRRMGRNKPDSSGIHESLRVRLQRMDAEIASVWHLASIIIDQCSKVFFDRTEPQDLRPEVMDLFAGSLSNVYEHITVSFQAFWHQVELEEIGDKTLNPRYLSINPEGTLLREAQDIVEELQMMTRIYGQQISVMDEFHKSLVHWNKQRCNNGIGIIDDKASDGQKESSDLDVIEDTMAQIRERKADIEELAGEAEKSCQSLQGDLLSLKQQQVTITALKRANASYEQGQSIMAFTIVAIIFAPLGFFTSFFGMNNSSTGQHWMSLWQQIITMFSISSVFIIVFFAVFDVPFLKLLRNPFKIKRRGVRNPFKTVRKERAGDGEAHDEVERLATSTSVLGAQQQVESTSLRTAGDIGSIQLQPLQQGGSVTQTSHRPHRAGTLPQVHSRSVARRSQRSLPDTMV